MASALARSPVAVREFLLRNGLAPHRDRGQNFLWDEAVAERLADSAEVAGDETVIEIGTGLGILTRALAARALRVVTIEVDAGIVRALRAESLLPDSVELLHADALDLDLSALVQGSEAFRVVANLPYSVATPLMRRLLDLGDRLRGWSVLVQREVARRIHARPGTRDYGSFAVLHQLATTPRPGLDLSPSCFYPVPRVVSTFLHLTPRRDAPDRAELGALERVLRAAFGHRRKTLPNALRQAGWSCDTPLAAVLEAHGVSPQARAQEIGPEQWRRLGADLAAIAGAQP